MALFTFQISAFAYFGIGFAAASLILLTLFSYDWAARFNRRAAQRDARRLAHATAQMSKILSDRDRLHADFAMSRQKFEISLRDVKAAAEAQMAALQEQIAKRDATLKRLRMKLRDATTAARNGSRAKPRTPEKSRRVRGKPTGRAVPGSKAGTERETPLH